MRFFKRVDIVFFGFVIITTLLLFFSRNEVLNFNQLILTRFYIIILSIGLIFFSAKYKFKILSFLRDIYPVIFSGYFYSETVFYNKLFFNNLDPLLIDYETALFGFQPSLRFSEYFNSLFFSELMYFGYFSFYLIIIGFVLCVYFKNKPSFNRDFFLLTSSLYLFYFLFGLVPSEGPQFYFSNPDSQVPTAYFFDKVMHFIQENGEQPTGAFPSSHVGISLIILIISKKTIPIFFKIALPITILLFLSTVYIKAHYLIDVFGGIIVAPLILFISKKLYYNLKTTQSKG
ncbi:phosphatase PAP2 family protein [uncultured Algibacter sp.]|uniref:phosphatase PAP2 family protein n=1 Tax=uncultured Algibacter sp. TaxID=298659 RepID=UPI002631C889|nr:phosphatase PAP2 family protein [uncultured Algibacter sp.]